MFTEPTLLVLPLLVTGGTVRPAQHKSSGSDPGQCALLRGASSATVQPPFTAFTPVSLHSPHKPSDMGDSDDELDRRRRDKFRRERSDMERSREREERRRDDWPERDWDRGRERRREYDRGRRERFSPPRHMSPQHKRMRRDWDDHRGDPYRYDMPYGGPPFPGGPHWPPELPHMPPPHGHPLQGRLG
ncbi:hypothetical protein WMY93_014802 [Mugilogobius chulae]|uniref:Uncharacterized protein n=1 Tax=Mugilogobius chulae TaxID=88201 RepID=A0AAW0P091_9GOBI